MNYIRQVIEFFFRKKWLGILLVLGLVLGVGASTFYRGAISPKQRTDLTVYLKAAEMIHTGRANHLYGIENIRHWHYVYSPFLAILLTPVVNLPLGVNVLLAYLFSLGALAGTFYLSRSFSEDPSGAGWKIVLSALLCLPLFINTLLRAQLGLVVLFLSALVFYGYLKSWKFLTGFLLAFGIALKISPLGFTVFFFLFKKEWKILASMLLGFVLFLFVFPSLVTGASQNWELLRVWHGLMATGSSDQAPASYLWRELFTPFAGDNQSLYAVITRLAWPSEAAFTAGSNALIRHSVSLTGILFLGMLFLKRLPSGTEKAGARVNLFAEYSLYPMLMLFFSPVTQIHHYTNLYLLFLASFFLMDQPPETSRTRRFLLPGIGICALSVFLGQWIDPLSFLGSPLWGSMLLWGIVLFSLRDASVGRG